MKPVTNSLTIDRKQLTTALKQISRVVPARCPKPILRGVRLAGGDGQLTVAATDAETAITVAVPADGQLDTCIVEAADLAKRVAAGKSPTCSIEQDGSDEQLILNGGQISHALSTLDSSEFPVIADRPQGKPLQFPTVELKTALHNCLVAAARESTRYAIDGVLLEADSTGVQLVATDGRRMVVCELEHAQADFQGCVILSRRLAVLLGRLIGKRDQGTVNVQVDGRPQPDADKAPPRLFVTGGNWLVSGRAAEGTFPDYRQVIPDTGTRIGVERSLLMEAVTEASSSVTLEQPALRLVFHKDRLHITAASTGATACGAEIPAWSLGQGHDCLRVGINAGFLLDAVKTLQADQLVLDGVSDPTKGGVVTRAIQLYPHDKGGPRWVIMPVNLTWPDPTVTAPDPVPATA